MAMSASEGMLDNIMTAKTPEELEALRVAYLGRKGAVTERLKAVGALAAEERAAAGQAANALRQQVEAALKQREAELRVGELKRELAAPYDMTAPGVQPVLGHRHP